MIYQKDLEQADKNRKPNRSLLKKLKKQKPKDLDDQFHALHEEVFQEIDCLECANCCKTTSPLFLESDIERLSKALKMKVPDFINSYLQRDEEGDYILQQAPCPFLGDDNKCIVYESRPKACREYPHTDRKRMFQITDLTYNNTLICPAVSRIVTQLYNIY
ncbi:YkgJ family cysteine cluster protein [Marinoscillum sp. MHG1-6]|uniref:YkgJ family cysteine cluster protein n=1 Tax=Marinoscillum sp. MHG1-6 TaxID=2959627 RepID=UPI002157DA0A|nr:YkgJ family cysteine cluster protein [Marinoscillum sp. MHG1-6]